MMDGSIFEVSLKRKLERGKQKKETRKKLKIESFGGKNG